MADAATRCPAGAPHGNEQPAGGSRLVPLAIEGLGRMWRPEHQEYAHTLRLVPGPLGPWLRPEGLNRRYSAIVALGASRLPEGQQRLVLRGSTAADFVTTLLSWADDSTEPGAVALTAWAAAEVLGEVPDSLVDRLTTIVDAAAVDTVTLAWALTAAVSTTDPDDARLARVRTLARDRLLAARGRGVFFPHRIPASSQPVLRRHVGSFADQIYPVLALGRLGLRRPDEEALAAALLTADRLVELQGEHGEWWWHYNLRDGTVVERFPVYSVHQHGMAPMVLHELGALSGRYAAAVARGVGWLDVHPQTVVELVDPRWSMIWRKVGRREPRRLVRGMAAGLTTVGTHPPSTPLDRFFPAGQVDHECRPYELGWLLYAWADPSTAPATQGRT